MFTLTVPITTVADDILIFFFFLRENRALRVIKGHHSSVSVKLKLLIIILNIGDKWVHLYFVVFVRLLIKIQSNLNCSNTDSSFIMANSDLFSSPYEILRIAQENKYLGKLSYLS